MSSSAHGVALPLLLTPHTMAGSPEADLAHRHGIPGSPRMPRRALPVWRSGWTRAAPPWSMGFCFPKDTSDRAAATCRRLRQRVLGVVGFARLCCKMVDVEEHDVAR